VLLLNDTASTSKAAGTGRLRCSGESTFIKKSVSKPYHLETFLFVELVGMYFDQEALTAPTLNVRGARIFQQA
jgi:hypothetical protein